MTTTRLHSDYISLLTILRKEVFRFLRIWTQTLIPPVITMSLYFVIFGKFIGSQIRHIDGFQYIQYIVPGLVMMSIVTNSFSNTASSFFLTKFNKSIEEMLVSPMPSVIILLGFMLSGALRGLLVGILVIFVGIFFTSVPFYHPLIMLLMSSLAAMVFSLGGLINAIYAKRFDDISFIPTFVLTPLTYLGGVFFSINQLPKTWKIIAFCNPILYMMDTFRYGMLGISDLKISFGFLIVSLLFMFLFGWAWFLLYKGIGIKA